MIGLLGKKYCGKDTAARVLILKHKFIRMAFGDPIKNISKELFNFSDDQLYGNNKETIDNYWNIAPRKIFQYLGTDIFRKDIKKILPHIDDNFWVLCLEKKYKEIMLNNSNNNIDTNIVITDVRYQNELDMIHKNGGIIIKINRPDNINIDDHESENYIDYIKNYDYCINNNASIDDLSEQIIKIFNLHN